MPRERVLEALDVTLSSKWVGEGPRVKEFEQAFSTYIGNPHCVAVNSCTSALELAYDLAGIKEGDEVVTPVLTCTATNHPLLRRRANIKFCDVDPITLNVTYETLSEAITPKTKAVVIVHLGGEAVEVQWLKERYPGVHIIEDCAQALGARYKDGTRVGNSGNLCAFSFQAIKHITTGDGGMLICPDLNFEQKAKRRRWFGIDREAKVKSGWHPQVGGRLTFQVSEAGYKFQMTDIAATIGLVQMGYLDSILKTRRRLTQIYQNQLQEHFRLIEHGIGSSNWTFGLFHPQREAVIEKLAENGIESNMVQIRNDIYDIFKPYANRELVNMDQVEKTYLYLPLHTNLTDSDVRRVCDVLKQ